MDITGKGLTCAHCKIIWPFTSTNAACIRLYAQCKMCCEYDSLEINEKAIDKNRIIWSDAENKQNLAAFGKGYSE